MPGTFSNHTPPSTADKYRAPRLIAMPGKVIVRQLDENRHRSVLDVIERKPEVGRGEVLTSGVDGVEQGDVVRYHAYAGELVTYRGEQLLALRAPDLYAAEVPSPIGTELERALGS